MADERVMKETVEVLQYVINQKESEEVLAKYLQAVFQRNDV